MTMWDSWLFKKYILLPLVLRWNPNANLMCDQLCYWPTAHHTIVYLILSIELSESVSSISIPPPNLHRLVQYS